MAGGREGKENFKENQSLYRKLLYMATMIPNCMKILKLAYYND